HQCPRHESEPADRPRDSPMNPAAFPPSASADLRNALCEAFPTLADLQQLVTFHLRVALNFLVDEHQPHPQIVFALLLETDRLGLPARLLRAAVVARQGRPDLHAIVARVCPAVQTLPAESAAEVEVIRRAVMAVRGRLSDRAVRQQVRASRAQLAAVAAQID